MTAGHPPSWTDQQLEVERLLAIEVFRLERTREPLDLYLGFYQLAREAIENLLELTVDLTQARSLAPEVLTDEAMADIARYLASPPLSADDLVTVAGVTLAPGRIQKEPDRGRILMDAILLGLDRERFPWVGEDREPSDAERETAIVSTAAMRAMRRAETHRRTEGKNAQEAALRQFLVDDCGFTEVPAADIPHLHKAPPPGHFSKEALVGSRKADVPIRLWDGRLMPVECKVSNSATNSYKRINNDAAVKAKTWVTEFGSANCVPAALMTGCFSLNTLQYSQNNGLTLFWGHDFTTLKDFIDSAR